MTLSSEKIKKTFYELSNALDELKRYEYEVKDVQWREGIEHQLTSNVVDRENIGGASILEIPLTGYKALLDTYKHLTNIKITEDDKKIFDEMHNAMSNMIRQSAIINIADMDTATPSDKVKVVDQLTNDAVAQLEKEGKVFVLDSARDHHAIAKYIKEDGEYYKIDYNAGFGAHTAVLRDEMVILSGAASPISDDLSFVKEIIKHEMEIKIGADKKPHYLLALARRYYDIDSPPDIVASQLVGNCSTRSTREMLRGHLSTEHFRNFYDMVVNVPYDDLKTALENKRNILSKALKINITEKTQPLSNDNNIRFQNTLREAFNQELGLPLDQAIPNIESVTSSIVSQWEEVKDHPDDIDFVLKKLAKALVDAEKATVKDGKVCLERIDDIALDYAFQIPLHYRDGYTADARSFITHLMEFEFSRDMADIMNDANASNLAWKPPANDHQQTKLVVAKILESLVSKDTVMTYGKVQPVYSSIKNAIEQISQASDIHSTSEFLTHNKDAIISKTRELLLERDDLDKEIHDYNAKMSGKISGSDIKKVVSGVQVQKVVEQLRDFTHPAAPKSHEELMHHMRTKNAQDAVKEQIPSHRH